MIQHLKTRHLCRGVHTWTELHSPPHVWLESTRVLQNSSRLLRNSGQEFHQTFHSCEEFLQSPDHSCEEFLRSPVHSSGVQIIPVRNSTELLSIPQKFRGFLWINGVLCQLVYIYSCKIIFYFLFAHINSRYYSMIDTKRIHNLYISD